MRIVILSEHFTKSMGYIENRLPKALARLGNEVHVVTSDLQVYHNLPDYSQTYERFQGPARLHCGIEAWDGYALHRLPHQIWLGYVRIVGLWRYLKKLRPDIVQVHAPANWVAMEAAAGKPVGGYCLFTGSHQTASIFSPAVKKAPRWSLTRLKSDFRRALPGRFVNTVAEKCYGATVDCALIAEEYYGVPRTKMDVCPLGIDTDLFFPIGDDPDALRRRREKRESLGFKSDEIVCVYTGRMNAEKNPLCLALAIDRLNRSSAPFRGMFVGDGPQAAEIRAISGCVTHDFVPANDLPLFYQMADIGVWPAFESLSMLDAAACSIPIIVSNRVAAVERYEGNGLTYEQGDADSMVAALSQLADPSLRRQLGTFGAKKVRDQFSWDIIARRRMADYESALRLHRR